MKALVVFESMYGNTHHVANASAGVPAPHGRREIAVASLMRRIAIPLVTALFVALLVAGAPAASAAPGLGQIRGTVIDATTGLPAPKVYVSVYSANAEGRISTWVTQANGTWAFNLPNGTYRVRFEDSYVSSNRYITEWHSDSDRYTTATDVVVADNEVELVDHLQRGGVRITGAVYQNGVANPIAGATITLYNADGGVVSARVTQSNQPFQFWGLPAGRYRLKVTHPDFFTEWYQDRFHAADSFVFDLPPGGSAHLNGTVNPRWFLTPVATPDLSGRVTDGASGAAVPGAAVVLYTAAGRVTTTQTDAAGIYRLGGSLIGGTTYFVRAEAPGYDSRWHADAGTFDGGATGVLYAGAPRTNIDIPL